MRNGITRNRLDLVFKGEGAECWCNGCVIADKSQHVDNNTLIDHQVGHCDSHELYKYVVACSCATIPKRRHPKSATRTSS